MLRLRRSAACWSWLSICAVATVLVLPGCTGGNSPDAGSFPTAVSTTVRPEISARSVLITERQEGNTIEVPVGTQLDLRLRKVGGAGWAARARVAPANVLTVRSSSNDPGGPFEARIQAKAPGTGYISLYYECADGKCRTWSVTILVTR